MKQISIILFFTMNCYSQVLNSGAGSAYQTYKTTLGGVTNSSIFTRPFQEYNYVKTHRGIEVYNTYNSKNYYNSTMLHKSIFSKPMPDFILHNNGNIYETYKYEIGTQPLPTKVGSVFQKPSQKVTIIEKNNSIKTTMEQISKEKISGLTYDPEVNSEPIEK